MVFYDCTRPESREAGLEHAARALRASASVVFATEASYAIGCDVFDLAAVKRYRNIRRITADAPLSVLVGSWNTLDGLVLSPRRTVRELVEAFWPGQLSLVVQHAPSLLWDVGRTGGTVTLRMPLHPVALELLRTVGPMAVAVAPSREGSKAVKAPLDIQDVAERVGARIGVFLDSGRISEGSRSTVVDVTGEQLSVLRVGDISVDAIEQVARENVVIADLP